MPQKKKNRLVAILIAACATVLLWPVYGYAQGISGGSFLTGPVNCGAPGFSSGLTSYIINCSVGVLQNVASSRISLFASEILPLVTSACVLALMFYGGLAVTGHTRQLKHDGFMLGLKIAGVLVFSGATGYALGGFVPAILGDGTPNHLGIINFFTSIVVVYTQNANSLAAEHVSCPMFTVNNLQTNLWYRLDCLIYRLFGDLVSGNISGGLLGVFTTAIFSPPIGFTVFLFGLAFLVIIILALGKALYIYISAYIAVAILLLISPFMIPLILFKASISIFEKWLRMLIGIFVQTAFLAAFVGMLLVAAEQAIFTGPYAVYRAFACTTGGTAGFSLGNYIAYGGLVGERSYANSIYDFSINVDSKELTTQVYSPDANQTGAFGGVKDWSGDIYGNNNVHLDVPTDAINWPLLASVQCGVNNASGLFIYYVNIIISMFIAIAIAYIFYIMLGMIPYLSSEVAGGILSAPNLGGRLNPAQMAEGVTNKLHASMRPTTLSGPGSSAGY